jgi:nucleotide-binding universal stress UspA family protein
MEAIIEGQTRHGNDAAARAGATMRAICSREQVRIVARCERGDAPSCSIRRGWGNVAVEIGNAAALSDLVVLGPIGWNNPGAFNEAFLDVLRDVRRPLLVAHAGARPFRRIVAGWDGSVTAARALSAAVPFLKKAQSVTLVTVGETQGIAADEAAAYLALHGVDAAIRTHARAPAGAALIDAARDADLLVMGAYGHSHLVEAILGGATADVLAHTSLPVLLVH